MTPGPRPGVLGAVALVLLLLAALVPTALAVHSAPSTGPSASPLAPAASATAATAPATAPAAPSSGSSPAASCPTPQNTYNWNSTSFFQDALVAFQVPGDAAISGANFNVVPCLNTIPEYEHGFWMNITTNVPISSAYVTAWGVTWPTPSDPLPALSGFDPAKPQVLPMFVPSTAPDTAQFYFNVYRYFYPGSTVFFNVTLESTFATPTTIFSTTSSYRDNLPSGYPTDFATWTFFVGSPWWSTSFSDDIQVSTTPPVISSPQYAPNPVQPISVAIMSKGSTGGVGGPIPEAQLNFELHGTYTGLFSEPFGPLNSTFENTTVPIGPYPNTNVTFYVTAWLPWEGGVIDKITSQNWSFNWSSKGGWWAPSQGLEGNANLSTIPAISNSSTTVLSTGTPVNVTVHEPIANVTISSALVRFTYTDRNGQATGSYPMTALNLNTTYGRIPGLPEGGRLSYIVIAKDVNDNPVSSGTYSYLEQGPTTVSLQVGQNWIFVEALNITTGVLLPGAQYTIANATWSGSGVTGPFGFGAPVAASGLGYRPLTVGVYTVTVTDFGQTMSTQVNLTGDVPLTVPFLFAHGPVTVTATVPVTGLVVGLIAGPIVAAVAFYPLFLWFRERQKRAAEEQKRITL